MNIAVIDTGTETVSSFWEKGETLFTCDRSFVLMCEKVELYFYMKVQIW